MTSCPQQRQHDTLSTPTDLCGRWRFNRVIEDHRTDQRLHATGIAEINSISDRLFRWTESGFLHEPQRRIAISRHLQIISTTEDSIQWWVLFPDGRRFYPLILNQDLHHECGDDLYQGRITPFTATKWELRWQASGPLKDFIPTTTYNRI